MFSAFASLIRNHSQLDCCITNTCRLRRAAARRRSRGAHALHAPSYPPYFQRRRIDAVDFIAGASAATRAAPDETLAALTALQDGPKRGPFRVHPAADQRDRGYDGDQHDSQKDGVFDEGSALIVLSEFSDQLKNLTHHPLLTNFGFGFRSEGPHVAGRGTDSSIACRNGVLKGATRP